MPKPSRVLVGSMVPMSPDVDYGILKSLLASHAPDDAYKMLRTVLDAERADAVIKRYEAECGRIRTLKDPLAFTSDRSNPWYGGPNSTDRFWPPLRRYLLEVKKWPPNVVSSLDDSTTKILSLMQPPNRGTVDTRGLVVGYVQSGKTANYTALIAKAVDVGYRLIIILAGIHNSLRSQTQARITKELVNRDRARWFEMTNIDADFRDARNTDAFLSEHGGSRLLFVVKKNATVLRRLLKWLEDGSAMALQACPTLIIDDEADQAGLNASKIPNTRTVINKLIHQILETLPKVAYVGYTATPFANVLIDPAGDQLYPRDFIVALSKPVGYFGAEQLFGRERLSEDDDEFETTELDVIRLIPDPDVEVLRPKSRSSVDDFAPSVPQSLQDALLYFLLSVCARRVRGHNDHCSMLIHTTVYTAAHQALESAVTTYWKHCQRGLRNKSQKSIMTRLEQLWSSESARVPAAHWSLPFHTFEELRPHLLPVLKEAQIVVENGPSAIRLNYSDEPRVQIAIGGNSLSRGLTLEGLLVSYFLRTTTAYDTLLQMGRWFGYRFGYEDLPRIWMTAELKEYFFTLATVEQEIRNDIARYERENLTPRDFGVRIRQHPKLAVTSALKMQKAVDCEISYSGTTNQTRFFKHHDAPWLADNIAATRALLESLGPPSPERQGKVFLDVPVERIIEFLRCYRVHEEHTDIQTPNLIEYIESQNDKLALTRWSVVVAELLEPDPALLTLDLTSTISVNLVNRARRDRNNVPYADLGTITTQSFFSLDLPPGRNSTSIRNIRRDKDDPPLLVLIPIGRNSYPGRDTKGAKRVKLEAINDIIGMSLSFPVSETPTPQRYVTVDLSDLRGEDEELYADEEIEEEATS